MDEHVPTAVSKGLRRRGVDVLTSQEAKMLSVPDREHLAFAANQSRVVVTQDADFLRLHARGAPHSGIVYAHQGMSVSRMIQGLMLLHQVLEPEDMVNHVEFL
ncbi:MAG: hypothetical protein D6770_01375 [Anaerolineae bacterium]|nr:MAG: hypothetical protein D6770_01375 [Anaerolineae bacterium]